MYAWELTPPWKRVDGLSCRLFVAFMIPTFVAFFIDINIKKRKPKKKRKQNPSVDLNHGQSCLLNQSRK